jgi:hypothetical protein
MCEQEVIPARAGRRESYGQMLLYELATVGIGFGGVGDGRVRQCRSRSKERRACVRERARGERMSRVPLWSAVVEVLQGGLC